MSKTRIQTQRVATWSEFTELLAEEVWKGLPPARGRYMFRGQANADWSLVSSFDRAFGPSSPRSRRLEQTLLDNFSRECESESALQELTVNRNRLTALAQHSGLPTRLLDWSDSPYVASFFAFQSHFEHAIVVGSLSEEVGVWVLDTHSPIWNENLGVQVVAIESWQNERIRRQAAYFTVSKTPFRTLEEYVESFDDDGEHDPLLKITIPASQAQVALADLDLMGINHGSLFGGVDAKAKAALTKTLLAGNFTSF